MSIESIQLSIKEVQETLLTINSYLNDHDEYTQDTLVEIQHAILTHVWLILNEQQNTIEELYKRVYKIPKNQEILRLKKLREYLGFNQREFADDIFVTKVTVSRWETGKIKPNTKKINQYMKRKGISIKDIE
tara:strand:- start:82 stop:477 length:396 start_codon:yes stop_codon:yes gene_type:complete